MKIQAISKYTRISPRKIRILANEVKKLQINDALNVLTFSNKRGAHLLKDVLEGALASAKNNYKLEKENLFINKIDISGGPAFKRWRAVSKGIAHEYKKRTSHILVVLEEIKPLTDSIKQKGQVLLEKLPEKKVSKSVSEQVKSIFKKNSKQANVEKVEDKLVKEKEKKNGTKS